jgi:hypothetical protein
LLSAVLLAAPLPTIYGVSAVVAVAMGLASFGVTKPN